MIKHDNLSKVEKRIIFVKNLLKFIVLALVIYVGYRFFTKSIIIEDLLKLMILPGIIVGISWILLTLLYKFVGEYLLYEHKRNKSADVLMDVSKIPLARQVSGPIRVGKDSTVVAAAILQREKMIKRDLKKMSELRDKLYIYDFNKLHMHFDNYFNAKRFVVKNEQKLKTRFIIALKNNNSFLLPEYSNKHESGLEHVIKYFKNKSGQKVFNDGLTIGGLNFLDQLLLYVVYYVRYVHIPNYILSNQPIIESLSFKDKDLGFRVKRTLLSKKFRQNMIRIKEDHPFPFTHSLIIIETEMAILNGNVDKQYENYIKNISGIREFFTLLGHLLGEDIFYYTVTQDPYRVTKSIRELQQVYIHVFKRNFRCTSPTLRGIISIFIGINKLIIKLLGYLVEPINIPKDKIDHFYNGKRTKRKKRLLKKINRKNNRSTWMLKNGNLLGGFIRTWWFNAKSNLSVMRSWNEQLFNKGYLEMHLGVYHNQSDILKKVKFPSMLEDVIIEQNSDLHQYQAFGFKMVFRISDSWGRYDTHFLGTVRESKTGKHEENFLDVSTWDGLEISEEDMFEMDYKLYDDLLGGSPPPEDHVERNMKVLSHMAAKEPKKFNKLVKAYGLLPVAAKAAAKVDGKEVFPPSKLNVHGLTHEELISQAIDRGIIELEYGLIPGKCSKEEYGECMIDLKEIESKELINFILGRRPGKKNSDQSDKLEEPGLDSMTVAELKNYARANDIKGYSELNKKDLKELINKELKLRRDLLCR